MQELEKRISHLRILLADIQGKRAQLTEMESQYSAQLTRIVEFVVYREGDVGNALSLMTEVQAKLDEVVQTTAHLGMVENKANMELEVLLLTKRVAEARSQLGGLLERQQELAARLSALSDRVEEEGAMPTLEEEVAQIEEIRVIYNEVEGEIARLHSLITDASDRAARTVQEKARRA
jgi:hypothetical protein